MMAKERERETTRTKLKCNRMMLICKLKFALLYSIIKENWEKDPIGVGAKNTDNERLLV